MSESKKNLWVFGETVIPKISFDESGAYYVCEVSSHPGQGAPKHVHKNEDETFVVLEGDVEIDLGDTIYKPAIGHPNFFERGIPHTYRNVGTSVARTFFVFSAGESEKFFEDIDSLSEGGTKPISKEDLAVVQEKRGIIFPKSPV
jgi:quercetin dioxygenase-like cupin family protein